MKFDNAKLGSLEEMVLLVVSILNTEAYSKSVNIFFKKELNKTLSESALHACFRRLTSKSYLESYFGEVTSVRGGKRKLYFKVTPLGKEVLLHFKELREKLWESQ